MNKKKRLGASYLYIACAILCLTYNVVEAQPTDNSIPLMIMDSVMKHVSATQAKGPRQVEVRKTETGFQLLVDGSPFYIKGAGGYGNLASLKACGGNTLRTWHATDLDSLMAEADILGIYLIVGIDIGRKRLGFDYQDQAAVNAQRERITNLVNRYKDHPSVLMWSIGNEVNLLNEADKSVWQELNHLSQMVHQLDPNHPTTTSIQMHFETYVDVHRYCPDLDILSFNVFGPALRDFDWMVKGSSLLTKRPFLLTEWTTQAYWQAPLTEWQAPIETSSHFKAKMCYYWYEQVILGNKNFLLGSCLFYWGNKQERTHTWFSIFIPDRRNPAKLYATNIWDFIHYSWQRRWPDTFGPKIDSMRFVDRVIIEEAPGNIYLQSAESYQAEAFVSYEGKEHALYWEILPEGNYQDKTGGDYERSPEPQGELIRDNSQRIIHFRAPDKPGAYRLFLYVYGLDDKAATLNIPFYVRDT